LLILGYHGVSMTDEHIWNPGLYVAPEFLRRRFEIIKESGCTVLSLDEGLEHLYAGTLPPKAVVITFDDGAYDFYVRAVPLIKEFEFPATLYLTTFYAQYGKPVFDVALSYLLWTAKGKTLDLSTLIERSEYVDLDRAIERHRAISLIMDHATVNKLSADGKNELLESLAEELQIDYSGFCQRRVLQLMNLNEIADISQAGIDVQLHTHRHRVPEDEGQFKLEIETNRRIIEQVTNKKADHFCYPNGEHNTRLFSQLSSADVVSATTTVPGLATRDTHPYLLPRFVDGSSLPEIEFEGWLTGVSHLGTYKNLIKN